MAVAARSVAAAEVVVVAVGAAVVAAAVIRIMRTLTELSTRFEQAADGAAGKIRLEKAMISRTLLLGLLLLSLAAGGS